MLWEIYTKAQQRIYSIVRKNNPMVYDHKEASKKIDRCWDTLNAILVSTITPEHPRMPCSKERILKTLAEAVIQYTGKKPTVINCAPYDTRFENIIYTQLAAELAEHGNELHPEIRTAINDLINPKTEYDTGPDHASTTCRVYTIVREGIGIPMSFGPTFSPPYDWVMQAKQKAESLSAEQRKDIEGIAKILREIWQK